MTKRKGAVSEETKEALLISATEEFYECGYEKASLRHICGRAGVTTGAIYCFFDGKEDLLNNVMMPIYRVVSSISIDYEKILADDYTAFAEFKKFFSANRKLYRILYNNISHPAIAEYISRLDEEFRVQIMAMFSKLLSENMGVPVAFDDYISTHLAHLMVHSIVKIIAEEDDDSIATEHLITMIKVYKNGIISLLK